LTRSQHYFTLELSEWLPPDRYAALLSCTVDGRSTFDRTRKVNTFLVSLSKLAEVERILERRIRLIKISASQVEGTVDQRENWKLDICIDVNQRIIVVILNDSPHPVPFEYVDFIWSQIKSSGVIRPREIWQAIERRIGMPVDSLYQDRGNYYGMYYWPIVALKWLGLVGQNGTGPLCLTQEGAVCRDWKEKMGMQYTPEAR
jgi:hypothetical protein